MTIENKALKYAYNAHKGQIRKSEPDKPMILHPINVGKILKNYGFDENVVAAGYLHDVVEDTEKTFDDIKKDFGEDIASLVYGASEPDKSLSWEERKKHTIESIKDLDLRHKAVICADKISNLEDLYYLFGKNGKMDFSHFKRGLESQKWYYTNVYESLIKNEDKDNPIFLKLNECINNVFNHKENEFLSEIVFNDDKERLESLNKLHYKKLELLKLKSLFNQKEPYVIEFTGTPRTGKTTLINNLEDFFKKGGFKVSVLEEFTTSKKYKKEIYPKLKDQYKNIINTEIPKYVLHELIKEMIDSNSDIIIVDRSLFDRLIWADRLYLKNGFTNEEYEKYKTEYIPKIKHLIDVIIATYTDPITSIKRDYHANLALEERHFLNIQNIEEYNTSLNNMEKLGLEKKININKIDTTNRSEETISIEIANIILDNMRKTYIKRLEKTYKPEWWEVKEIEVKHKFN